VLNHEQYETAVSRELFTKHKLRFRDSAELNQATKFLHENGLLLHYEDATLRDLYFLDPQWLCGTFLPILLNFCPLLWSLV